VKRTILRVAIFAQLFVFLLSGCGTQHRFQKYTPMPNPDRRIPMALALVMPPSVCTYKHAVGDVVPDYFYVGESICRNIEEAARLSFQTVMTFDRVEDPNTDHADALLMIRKIRLKGYNRRKIPAMVGYWAVIEWSFSTSDGKSRYVRQLAGNGEDIRTFGYVFPRHRDSLQRCLDDLGKKAFEEMAVSLEKGRKNLETEMDILTKFNKYEIGVTTFGTYKVDQTKDWNVRLVEIEGQAKRFNDDLVERAVVVKEMVRPVYGENLICNLEFSGKDQKNDNIPITAITCDRDGKTIFSRGKALKK
jgi:hypothetical protein